MLINIFRRLDTFYIVLIFCFTFSSSLSAGLTSQPRRVALVIGQNAYKELSPLANPGKDARRMAAILDKHGFDVISCDGKSLGCFDQSRTGLLRALTKFEVAADGADLALVFYAGHGMEGDIGNILAPTDARIDCKTWGVSRGILLEQFVVAASPAKHKIIILDACRDNPLKGSCKSLTKRPTLSFKDIKVPNANDFLLVTSTKPGQQAQDGLLGQHSPFAKALFDAFNAEPNIYFDQLFNRVAKQVIQSTKESVFLQIPEAIIRGGAPQSCLSGIKCAADPKATAFLREVDALKASLNTEIATIKQGNDLEILDKAMKSHSSAKFGQVKAITRFIKQGRTFDGSDWSGGMLASADIRNGSFKQAKLHALDLRNSNGSRADFSKAGLRLADMDHGRFDEADFSGAYAPLVKGRKSSFRRALFEGANFTGGDFRNADFRGASLKNASFAFADLRGAKFDGANLSGAFLTGALLDGVSFAETTISRTDFLGAMAMKFDLTAKQKIGACRSGVDLDTDGIYRAHVRVMRQIKSGRYKSGYEYDRLTEHSLYLETLDDNSLPLCPKTDDTPVGYYPSSPGSMNFHVDAYYVDRMGRNTLFRRRVKEYVERISTIRANENFLKGSGSQNRSWNAFMAKRSKKIEIVGEPHINTDQLLLLLLKHEKLETEKIKWQELSKTRHRLEREIERKFAGNFPLMTMWPRLYPLSIPYRQLSAKKTVAYRKWVENRVRHTPDRLILRPRMIGFRKLLKTSSAEELEIPLVGFLISWGGSVHSTSLSNSSPRRANRKLLQGRWLGIKVRSRAFGLEGVILLFPQKLKNYSFKVKRSALEGIRPQSLFTELVLRIRSIDIERKRRNKSAAIIFVDIGAVHLKSGNRIIWSGSPVVKNDAFYLQK